MTSVSAATASLPTRLAGRRALDVWRGVTRKELLAAFLFGLGYFLYQFMIYGRDVLRGEAPVTLPVIDFVTLQIGALVLMLCIVVVDRVTIAVRHKAAGYALAVVISGALAAPVATAARMTMPFFVSFLMSCPEYAQRSWHFIWAVESLRQFWEWLIVAGTATFGYIDWRRAQRARARMHAAELERAESAKRTLEARLQAMQARVEPGFLFNTLAKAHELYRADTRRGERMLDELINYLRTAMPKMRESSSTVGQEIELMRAYLAIARLRVNEGLAFEIEPPASGIADIRMPPTMLLALVDHAMAHSFEESHAKDSIRIRTVGGGGAVRIEIAHGGEGFLPESEDEAIVNIRERLDAVYEGSASLSLQRRAAGGTEAVMEIPSKPVVTSIEGNA